MSIEANKKEFMGMISEWLNKPLAFPPYSKTIRELNLQEASKKE